MRKSVLMYVAVSLLALTVSAQTEITADGNWNNSGIWLSGNIGNTISEDVFIRNNVDVSITSPDAFTCGNISTGNNPSISIASGATLSVGSPGNPRNLSSNNGMTITVAGDLIIYGNLNVDNNLIISITGIGTVTIIGNLTMNNNASITVNGNLNVGGNFVGGNNTSVTVNGTVTVTGSTTVGNGSTLNGSGSFITGPPCTGPTAFCSNPILPVNLLYFKAIASKEKTILRWATAQEENSELFYIEKSNDGLLYSMSGQVLAQGDSRKLSLYEFEDLESRSSRSYYRLKMIDRDGSFEYSDVVVAYHDEVTPGVRISPNPVRSGERLHIQTETWNGGRVSISITDLLGRQLLNTETVTTELEIPASWTSGIYLVSVSTSTGRTVNRILVR